MSFLNELNKEQQSAVKAINGPVMIVAGAGSGKTRVLTYRICYLIKKGVKPYHILALTFTNKAAKEMKIRIANLVGTEADDIWMGTFHSNFAKILRIECEKLGYTRNFSIYDSDESLSLVKNIMAGLKISANQFNPNSIQARISKAKNKMLLPEEFEKHIIDIFEEMVSKVYNQYQIKLRKNNAMDFDDLLLNPIELFTRFPDIAAKYQKKFSYVLVDEYQDTNKTQYQVLKLLAARHKNLCVVGDDAQSIYSFRGAEIQNILDFQVDYKDHQIFRLEQNYRSTQNILAAADCVIKKNTSQITKTLWTKNNEGEKLSLIDCRDEKDEGIQIVKNIQNLIRRDKLSLNSFVVLYRTNAQSRSIEDAFRRSGLPYIIVGGIKFYERKEIKDVLAYLKFISNPMSDESLDRIINFPTRGIGATSFSKVKEYAYRSGLTIYQSLGKINEIEGLSERVKDAARGFTNLIEKYIRLKNEMLLNEFVRALVDELEIIQAYKIEGTPEAQARIENIQELLSGIMEFQNNRSSASLEDFLQDVSLISDIDQYENSKNAVTLMTVHASKGLEFPVVFISGLEEGLFPHANSMDSVREIEEERRLFYVAVTRSMNKVFLLYAKLRYRFGNLTASIPSRFLQEINSVLIEKSGYFYEEIEKPKPTIGQDDVKWIPLPAKKIALKKEITTETNQYKGLKVGTIVEHDLFGRGLIVESRGLADDTKVVVDFDNGQRKTLMLLYANLKIINSD